MKISVILNVLNEEENIENVLRTVQWADEIVVVDQYSDDNTVEIAKKYTDSIYTYERTGYVVRSVALEKAKNPWILILDADELVPKNLADELVKIANEDKYDVVYLPRDGFYHGGNINTRIFFSPLELLPRFVKKNKVKINDLDPHRPLEYEDNLKILHLKGKDKAILHMSDNQRNQPNVFIPELNNFEKYTTMEAENIALGKKNFNLTLHFLWHVFVALKNFIFSKFSKNEKYYLTCDAASTGVHYYALLNTKIKLYEKYGDFNFSENILNEYDKIADKIAEEYKNEEYNK